MTAVAAREVDRAVASRGAAIGLLLFYGPDAGRVSERARVAARAAVADPEDPFQLIRVDGDAVADEPGRLVEEASTFGLFGGSRAIWVRPTGRNLAPAVVACLDVSLVDTLVVVEAGDLSKSSPLRAACEKSPRALALPCYADEERDLGAVITDGLRAYGLSLQPGARELLIDSVGGDRLATRSELAKLALYAHGRETVTIEDVEAVVSDVSPLSYDAAIDAAFCGDHDGLASALGQAALSPDAVVALAIRHGMALLSQLVRLGGGTDYRGTAERWRGLHFRRRDSVARQLRIWPESGVSVAILRLQEGALTARHNSALGRAAASAALFAVAALALSGGRASEPAA